MPKPLGLEMEAPEPDEADTGYELVIHVDADGSFTLDDDPAVYDDVEAVLLAVLTRLQSRPHESTPHAQMAAGYGLPHG